MKSHAQHDRPLPPMELRKSEQAERGFRNSEHAIGGQAKAGSSFRNPEHDDDAFSESERIAALLFDEALDRAGLTNKEVAHLCRVSVSLVEKWRKPDARGCPSFTQMLRLPVQFHLALHRAMNKRYGFGRAALAQVLEGLGMLAVEQG